VVGAPGEDVTVNGRSRRDVGGALLYEGSLKAGCPAGSRYVTEQSAGVPGISQAGDHFGAAIGVADRNGNLIPEVFIGVPGKQVGGHAGAGRVVILRDGGLDPVTVSLDSPNIPGASSTGAQYGAVIGSVDLDGDHRQLPLIAAPHGNVAGVHDAGLVVLLDGPNSRLIHEGVRGRSASKPEPGDDFGAALIS
jgi:hypothetical protein